MELMKPCCEECRLVVHRSKQICDKMAWVNGASGSTHNMLEKIKRHDKTANHVESSAIFRKWKSGKTLDEEKERDIRRSSRFWVILIDRVISIILTLTTLNLVLRGHREEIRESNCKGEVFLGSIVLLAEYDEVLSEAISLPARATKYLSPKFKMNLLVFCRKHPCL